MFYKSTGPQIIVTSGSWYRDPKNGRIEAISNIPASRKNSVEDPKEIERRIVKHEAEAVHQREKDIEQFSFDLPPERLSSRYDYKDPFSEEYNQAIAFQAQLQGPVGSNEWNLRDFYRDVKTKFESGTNTKAVFEKCIKLAR